MPGDSFNIRVGSAPNNNVNVHPDRQRRIRIDIVRSMAWTGLFVCWAVLILIVIMLAITYSMNLNHVNHTRESQKEYFRDICRKPEMLSKYKTYEYCHELQHIMDQDPRAAAFMQTGAAWLGLCKVIDCAAIGSKINFVVFTIFLIILALAFCMLRYGSYIHFTRQGLIPEYAPHPRQE